MPHDAPAFVSPRFCDGEGERRGGGGRREGGGTTGERGVCRGVAMMKSFRGLAAKTWLWWGEHCRVP